MYEYTIYDGIDHESSEEVTLKHQQKFHPEIFIRIVQIAAMEVRDSEKYQVVTPQYVAEVLCKKHGFIPLEPKYSIHLDDLAKLDKSELVDRLEKEARKTSNAQPDTSKKTLVGTILRDPLKPVYYSERGFPLVTQSPYILEYDEEAKGILTVENYDKWYRLYMITRDGEVKPVEVSDTVESSHGLTWIDHVVVPEAFHLTAEKLGLVYDNLTFALVCERFVSDHLEDWTRLWYYLPQAKMK